MEGKKFDVLVVLESIERPSCHGVIFDENLTPREKLREVLKLFAAAARTFAEGIEKHPVTAPLSPCQEITPQTGDRGVCADCREPLEYFDGHWRHFDPTLHHIAIPIPRMLRWGDEQGCVESMTLLEFALAEIREAEKSLPENGVSRRRLYDAARAIEDEMILRQIDPPAAG